MVQFGYLLMYGDLCFAGFIAGHHQVVQYELRACSLDYIFFQLQTQERVKCGIPVCYA